MNVIGIGNGGIGGYTVHHLDRLIELKQIKNMNFTFYDDDKVELKNILYQNFTTKDIDSYKSDALSYRYFNINFNIKRLDYNDLKQCDLVILCADNNKIRHEAYRNWIDNRIPFIDSRANGRAIGIFSSDTKNYEQTLSSDTKSSSCQNPFQIERKEIEYGNVVIASILAQIILNYSRSNKLPVDLQLML
ncbi:MAG: ThiF family adenylyltransferase [Candidatus Omnitrophica bacterium]|jgi:molybdopterin/thiamine biosynthesis adenylyltransferase|nr:ThiF family adenylyltransferase [Candidatus Omnitrophota bacterium]